MAVRCCYWVSFSIVQRNINKIKAPILSGFLFAFSRLLFTSVLKPFKGFIFYLCNFILRIVNALKTALKRECESFRAFTPLRGTDRERRRAVASLSEAVRRDTPGGGGTGARPGGRNTCLNIRKNKKIAY